MKVLVYGARGWIGNQIVEYLNNQKITYIIGICRINNEIELQEEIRLINPTHIISCIARTQGNNNTSTSEYLQDPNTLAENIAGNLYTPLLLAIISEELSIHYTYLGTGCIFNYDLDHPIGDENTGFKEEDHPNFVGSNYSIVKGYTDKMMRLFNNTLNLRLRTCINYQKNNRNFITKFISYEKICSMPNSITSLPDLIPAIIDMMSKNIIGTVNLTNHGLITHDEILNMYKEIVDPTFTWKNMTLEEQSEILISEKANNFLDTTKLKQLCPYIKSVKEAVKDCLLNYK